MCSNKDRYWKTTLLKNLSGVCKDRLPHSGWVNRACKTCARVGKSKIVSSHFFLFLSQSAWVILCSFSCPVIFFFILHDPKIQDCQVCNKNGESVNFERLLSLGMGMEKWVGVRVKLSGGAHIRYSREKRTHEDGSSLLRKSRSSRRRV